MENAASFLDISSFQFSRESCFFLHQELHHVFLAEEDRVDDPLVNLDHAHAPIIECAGNLLLGISPRIYRNAGDFDENVIGLCDHVIDVLVE